MKNNISLLISMQRLFSCFCKMDNSITILEKCHVSPPPNSILTPSTIPLSFLDIPWFFCRPMQRIFFYQLPNSTLHVTNTIIPQLKHSLSAALKHFYPLVGSVVCPSRSDIPYILYQHGDSIPFIVAESNRDFSHLVKNYTKDVREFHPLVPPLIPETDEWKDTNKDKEVKIFRPLATIQVTIFPNSGICIGFTFQHVVADGRSINHFIKSWASILKSKNDDLPLSSQPLLDRTKIIKAPDGHLPIPWSQWYDYASFSEGASLDGRVRATFVFSRLQIDKLKHKISSHFDTIQEQAPVPHVSTFVATYAFVWECFVKMDNIMNVAASATEDNCLYHFIFLADATECMGYHVSKNYFGNCLTPRYGSLSKSELSGKNGLFEAAKSFMKELKELRDGNFRSWGMSANDDTKIFKSGGMISVAGSPKLRVYETDFGWGRPMKSEVVHIDQHDQSISLSESRDEIGGVEIGLALNKDAMDVFISIFDQGLNNLC